MTEVGFEPTNPKDQKTKLYFYSQDLTLESGAFDRFATQPFDEKVLEMKLFQKKFLKKKLFANFFSLKTYPMPATRHWRSRNF